LELAESDPKERQMAKLNRREVLRRAALAGATGLVGSRLIKTTRASDTYSSVVLAKGPVGYWRLGEASGPTAADASGNGYDGTYFGTPTFGQLGAIANDSDTAVGFNGPGSMDYAEVPDPDSHPFSQPTSELGLTVEVWMRPDTLYFQGQTSEIYIHWLGKGVELPGLQQCEWALRFYSLDSPSRPNWISAYVWSPTCGLGAGAHFTNFPDVLTVGEWIHVVAVYEAGDKDTDPPAGVRIYKNGVFKQGPPSSGTLYKNFDITPAAGPSPLRLATRDAATDPADERSNSYFTGALDEVAIYPRVLTPDEILENYTTGIS
jgi:hypothetical protein